MIRPEHHRTQRQAAQRVELILQGRWGFNQAFGVRYSMSEVLKQYALLVLVGTQELSVSVPDSCPT